MIQVQCGSCEQTFEVGDEFAGLREFCPACGVLNDVPQPGAEEDEPAAADFSAARARFPAPARFPPPGRGIPSALWWIAVVGGVGAFVIICFFLFGDNWESQHVRDLSDAVNRGDGLLAQQDYTGAEGEYRHVLESAGHRTIQSTYIRQLIQRARQGDAAARSGVRPGASTAPSAAGRAAPPLDDAIENFQRDSEGFAQIVRAGPMVYRDERGNWRRRQFVVWDVGYERQGGADPPQMLLRYSLAARITEAHADRAAAGDDPNFVTEERPGVIECQTLFELREGTWRVLHRQAEPAGPLPREFCRLEEQAFHATPPPEESR